MRHGLFELALAAMTCTGSTVRNGCDAIVSVCGVLRCFAGGADLAASDGVRTWKYRRSRRTNYVTDTDGSAVAGMAIRRWWIRCLLASGSTRSCDGKSSVRDLHTGNFDCLWAVRLPLQMHDGVQVIGEASAIAGDGGSAELAELQPECQSEHNGAMRSDSSHRDLPFDEE